MSEQEVSVWYETYKNDVDDLHSIINRELAPGIHSHMMQIKTVSVASVGHPDNNIHHAMVLDTYDQRRDVLIFKNTYNDPDNGWPKKYKIARTHENAPTVFYFVHIEVRDMANLPTQEERKRRQKK